MKEKKTKNGMIKKKSRSELYAFMRIFHEKHQFFKFKLRIVDTFLGMKNNEKVYLLYNYNT